MQSKLGLAIALGLSAFGAAAHADAILSPQHQVLGQGVQAVVDGKFREAEPILRRAIDMDRMMPEAHYNLGVVLRNDGRFDEAVVEYRFAFDQFAADDEANRAKSLYGIALATESSGDSAKTASAWRDYIRFDGRFAAAQPAIHVAQSHLMDAQQDLAAGNRRPPGTQKAGR